MRIVSSREVPREDWLGLWASGENSSPFIHPAWHEAYSEVARKDLHLAVAYRGRDLVSLLPLERRAFGWRSAAAAVSDHGEPLLAESAERSEFLQETAELCGGRVALHGLTRKHSGSVPVAQGRILRLPEGDWLGALSSGHRRDYRAMVRKGMGLSVWRGPDALGTFDRMAALHQARWRRRGLPGGFYGRRSAFHRRFLSLNGPGMILEASLDGETLGAIYLLQGSATWAYYQAGIRPMAGLSPGTFLIAEAVRLAAEAEVAGLDFLRGTENYKARWAPEGAYPIYQWRPSNQWLSQVARRVESLKARAENFG